MSSQSSRDAQVLCGRCDLVELPPSPLDLLGSETRLLDHRTCAGAAIVAAKAALGKRGRLCHIGLLTILAGTQVPTNMTMIHLQHEQHVKQHPTPQPNCGKHPSKRSFGEKKGAPLLLGRLTRGELLVESTP